MDLPAGMFLKPVDGEDDLFAFAVGGKALDEVDVVAVEDSGDLIISGYAAVWDGVDREGENFVPGAFTRATKAFLDAGGPLCFHHKKDHLLGAVTALAEDDIGLKFEARVDAEIQKDPKLAALYHQIKKGSLKGVSVGGFFKRALIEGKRKITDMDFTELSLTGVPMHTGPSFQVVAGKALTEALEIPDGVDVEINEDTIRDSDFAEIQWQIESLGRLLKQIGKRGADDSEDKPTGDLAVAL